MAKAAPKKDEKKPDDAVEGEAPAPEKKGKLPLVLGLVVLLAAAGGGAWFFLIKDKGAETEQPAKTQAPKPPVFVPLDTFTVNLSADESGQYLQVGATLRVLDQAAADAVKQYMPEIRHRTLGLLASKKPSEIATGEGRERLAEELRQNINNILLAAAGRPVKPIALDVPAPAGETAPAGEDKPAEAPTEAARPAEGATPQEGAAAAAGPTPADGTAAPAAAPAPRRATLLARAAADDPAQGVLFTSFIIQ